MPAPDYAIDAIQAPLPAALDTWHVATAPPLTITYAFEAQQSPEFLHIYTGWTGWSAGQKDAVRWALSEYESVVNVHFVEVAAGVGLDPDIAFGRVGLEWGGESWWKLSNVIDASGQLVSKGWDVGVVYDNDVDLTAPSARWLILHEIGHAMMMKHTGNYDVTGVTTPGPFLSAAEDNRDYTVMSYNLEEGAAVARQLQLYDVAALQARWGANTHEAAGDNVYTFDEDPGIFAIWDTGGTDRIDAGAATGPADIDLAEGAFTQLSGQNRMSIAWGVQIENATGGAYADRITGNALDNRLAGGSGADTIEAGLGADTLDGGEGIGFLRGDEGNDWIVGGADFDDMHGNMGDDTVLGGAGDDWVVGGKDQDQLYGDDGGDIVWGNLGADTNDGGGGDDQVRGGQGDDVVYGGAGDDYVSGDRGNDTVVGGAGADVFHGSQDQGLDIIMDFSIADGDRVMLDPGTLYTLHQQGTDVIIDTGDGNLMIVANVELSALPSGWLFEGWAY